MLASCVNIEQSKKTANSTKEINLSFNQTTVNNTIKINQSAINNSVNFTIQLNNTLNSSNSILNTAVNKTNYDFSIYFPIEGYKAKGDIIAVSVKLVNLSLGKIGDDEKEGIVILHYFIDSSEKFVTSEKATFTISNLSKGKHILTVELAGTNGTKIDAKRSVSFEAQSVTG